VPAEAITAALWRGSAALSGEMFIVSQHTVWGARRQTLSDDDRVRRGSVWMLLRLKMRIKKDQA